MTRQSLTVKEMQQHVDKLCERHEIHVWWRRDHRGGYAAREHNFVSIPPIKSAITYAIALHEIGHLLGRHQRSRSRLVRERWAWAWARRNAIKWTPAMERTMRSSLDWYAQRSWPPIKTFAELNPNVCGMRLYHRTTEERRSLGFRDHAGTYMTTRVWARRVAVGCAAQRK
jgi:hypothetical protein